MYTYSIGAFVFALMSMNSPNLEGDKNTIQASFLEFIPITIFLWSIFTVSYVVCKSKNMGLAPGARSLVMKRHVFSIIIYNLSNVYLIICACVAVYTRPEDEIVIKPQKYPIFYGILTFFQFLWYCQGLLLSLIRTAEPIFFKILINDFK